LDRPHGPERGQLVRVSCASEYHARALQSANRVKENNHLGWWTRERVMTIALFLVTMLALTLCFLLIQPFVPALTWALALAIVVMPVHRWIERRVRHPNAAAGLSVVLVAVTIVAPSYFIIQSVAREVTVGVDQIRAKVEGESWASLRQKYPRFGRILAAVERQVDIRQTVQQAAAAISTAAVNVVRGSVAGVIGLLVMFFFLFFFFRDRAQAIDALRKFLPLTAGEADTVFRRVNDTVYATINGTVVVAFVQGILGGLMFWWLGLTAPFLWGTVMAALSIVPILGAFIVWIPAALMLALQGSWIKAIILTVWGAVVIGLIDNILYPLLVGKRIRLHIVPVFIALVGGIMVFGASGLILGPLIFALTIALLEVWRKRTAAGGTADDAIEKAPGPAS
jgi:predicted PurR-regulated permease PerM